MFRNRDPSLRLTGVFALVAILSYLHRHDFIDDALIYARYIANALHGWGLVFNHGERVNALTSPLYSYLVLGMAKLLGGRVLAASITVSAVAFFAACTLAELQVPFAGLLLAATGYFYTLFGMETALFLALLLLPAFLVEHARYNWLPTAAVLLVFSRFEGAALLPALALELYRRRRWPAAAAYLPATLLVLLYLALNHHWYGAAIPASAGAKLGQGRSGFWGVWPRAFFGSAYQLKPDFLSTIYVPIAVVGLLLPGLRRLRSTPLLHLSLPFLGILLSFYVLFNLPGYRWYFAPFVAFAMMYACAGLPQGPLWRWGTVAVLCASAGTAIYRARSAVLPEAAMARQGYPAIGQWLTRNASPTARVEAGEIGTIGWYCQRCHLIDILGLTYPKNAEHIAHRDATSWFAEDRPDFVVVHRQPWVFEDVAKQSPDMERVPVDFGPVVYLLRRRSGNSQANDALR